MSSHHIVREKQEPALLVLSLENFDPEHLGQLLEWSPTVIVNEGVYEHADSLGIKIDGIVTTNENYPLQQNTLIIPTENDPLEDGLKYLAGEQYPSVNIVTEKFSVKDYALFAERIDLVIYMEDKKIFPVRSGFSKWRAAGEKVLLMQKVGGLKTSGLKQLNHHTFETEKDGFYTLAFDNKFIFIAEGI